MTTAHHPRVTVCIPTYNRARMLQGALTDVLGHDFDFVVIVSDNGSTDDTAAVVESFDDARLRYLRRERNFGLIDNFNFAMAHAETEFIVLLPDDDRLLPGSLERSVAALDRHPTAGIVHSSFNVIDVEGRVLKADADWMRGRPGGGFEPGREFIRRSLPHSSRICVPAAMFRRATLPDPPFEPTAHPLPDTFLWLTIALDHDVVFLSTAGAAFRSHAESDSASFGRLYGDTLYVFREDIVVRMRDVKLAWVERFRGRLSDPSDFRRLVLAGSAHQLLDAARVEPTRLRALRRVERAFRIQPDVVFRLELWRRVVEVLIGSAATNRIRRSMGRDTVPGYLGTNTSSAGIGTTKRPPHDAT